LLGLTLVWVLGACSSGRGAVPVNASVDPTIHFVYAIYYLPKPQAEVEVVAAGINRTEGLGFKFASAAEAKPASMTVSLHRIDDVGHSFAPPDLQALRYFGRGLDRDQAEGLQRSEVAYALEFAHPSKDLAKALAAANKLAFGVARATGGLIWDEAARVVFTPEAWQQRYLGSPHAPAIEVPDFMVIHSYNEGDFARAVTLGMAKFGLPDISVDQFAWSMNRQIGNLINAVCQAMVEGAKIEPNGDLDLDLRAIRQESLRAKLLEGIKEDADTVAHIRLQPAVPQQGDADNRQLVISFDRYEGPDATSRQDALISSLFGWHDEIVRVDHSAVLLAASERARAELPALRSAFEKGLLPGEYIEVKAPFETSAGGREWMWVEVRTWSGSAIRGMLSNEPDDVPGLHGGQMVDVKESEVFDWLRVAPDGSKKGNSTGAILERMSTPEQLGPS
jgi:uncharacterized protein YegJ (DUF2314 family)